MAHPFMKAAAHGLADRGYATVRSAVAAAARLLPDVPPLAGGKSFGGRMASQGQADAPLPGVRGLAFFGFPLHPAGKPAVDRAAHLARNMIPLLFLQSKRDTLAEPVLLCRVMEGLEDRATLWHNPDPDHSFHVPARSDRTDAGVLAEALDAFASWAGRIG